MWTHKIWLNAKFMFIVNGCFCAMHLGAFQILLSTSMHRKSNLLKVHTAKGKFLYVIFEVRFPRGLMRLKNFQFFLYLLSDLLLLILNFCTTVQTCHLYVCPFSHTHPWSATALSKNSKPNSMQLSILRLDAIEKYHRFALDLLFI